VIEQSVDRHAAGRALRHARRSRPETDASSEAEASRAKEPVFIRRQTAISRQAVRRLAADDGPPRGSGRAPAHVGLSDHRRGEDESNDNGASRAAEATALVSADAARPAPATAGDAGRPCRP
jgi:hypothetical protein